MNRIYALVWNQAQGCWKVASEGSRRRRRAGGCKGSTVLAGFLAMGVTGAAMALPTGSNIVSGSADILVDSKGTTMSVNQHTGKLVTHWEDFNVDAGQTINFRQPDSSSIALNRVVGVNGSQIQGQINANGKVFLINPNGVVFGQTAQVNVGGLVASTQDLSDKDFEAGQFKFSGDSPAQVINNGTLNAADGGYVALLGAQVSNNGVIKARMGRVALGAGNEFNVTFDDNNLLNLQVDAAAVNALVSNGGLLKADAGQVLMTARSMGSMTQTVVNNQGTIEANTLSRKSGRIILDGGDEGTVKVAGALSANALGSIGDGGVIETRGANTQVQKGTRVNTLASNGKTGTWKVASSELKVGPTATTSGGTVYADTLSRNLENSNIELASQEGDVVMDGNIQWSAGHRLSVSSAKDLKVNSQLTASAANTKLHMKAKDAIKLNGNVALTGANSGLELEYGSGFTLGEGTSVTLSGSGAGFKANGDQYNVIQTAEQLEAVNNGLHGQYVLGNNIDGTKTIKRPMRWWEILFHGQKYDKVNTELKPIGGDNVFTGVFDGLGNTLSHFTVNGDGANVGLFAASSGKISNLKLASMTVNGAGSRTGLSYIGGLVGYNTGSVSNISATGLRVSGWRLGHNNIVGGLVGGNSGGDIDRASVVAEVIGSAHNTAIGGLVGENSNSRSGIGTITNSSSKVVIPAAIRSKTEGGVGGLVGINKAGYIADSSSSGSVGDANDYELNLGGLVGLNSGGKIIRTHSSVAVRGAESSNLGGLVGFNDGGDISSSQATGTVYGRGSSTSGGTVGLNQGGKLVNVTAFGEVRDDLGVSVGGLIGKNIQGQLDTVAASGNVRGGDKSHVGGLMGDNLGGFTRYAVAKGRVDAGSQSHVGGLIGYNDGDLSTVDASGQVTGQSNSFVGGLLGSNANYMAHTVEVGTARGNVYGGANSNVGGLVGENQSVIVNSQSSGDVGGSKNAILGGLVGLNRGDVRLSETSSKINFVSRDGQIYGGLVGSNYGSMSLNTLRGSAILVPVAGINNGTIQP